MGATCGGAAVPDAGQSQGAGLSRPRTGPCLASASASLGNGRIVGIGRSHHSQSLAPMLVEIKIFGSSRYSVPILFSNPFKEKKKQRY